ncbi:hypothetical protein V6N11_032424 [Hibiscus sabdariffa]|uniref:non-specific serine/threonine protein kinase n=1 Tax=Hibiscus sabdariffa TaxID=183260 RepID=A0ABR2T1E0_9ROSI
MMKPHPSVSECLLYFFFFWVVFSWCSQSINARNATTDPSEVRALNSIFQQWRIRATDSWNISGEPCSGVALSKDDFEFGVPSIRCDCPLSLSCDCDSTACHITKLSAPGLGIRGVIPVELLKLPFLTYLWIDYNFFYGPLPAFIGNLSRLETLSLAVNNFSGTLPQELGNLVNLQGLYINSCGSGGEIPSTFANLKNLQKVWASGNAFTGKIPEFVGNNWTKLTELRFQGNSFEGPIPSNFANLTSLTSLRIGDIYNGSTSCLDFIRNLKNLNNLVLRNVMLTGTLPSYITELQSLQKLDLSFNNLTGQIPSTLFNMNSLRYLFLGNNSLSGAIPDLQTTPQTIDSSYNLLSGDLPPWGDMTQLNLVGNNFTRNSSNIRLFPGLECLQRSFPCNRDAPRYASFSINCGGPEMISNGIVFEADNRSLGPATYDVSSTQKWAVSNVGLFLDRENQHYVQNTSAQVRGTSTPGLYENSRLSPGSLRYYGLGLENGLYTVNLFFAEIGFPDPTLHSWRSRSRCIFDVYIQGTRRLRDFDISKEAGGVQRAIIRNFTANVTANHLEIHLFWAGKGTPDRNYGPSISAISVVPNFVPTVGRIPSKEKNWKLLIVSITVAVFVSALIFIFAIFYIKRKKEDDEDVLVGICTKPNTFSYSELKTATEDFNEKNKLGEGGFGAVYKQYEDNKTHITTGAAGTFGRPNSDNSLEHDKIDLLGWAWTLHENNQSLDLVDPNLAEFNEIEALRVIRVALLCTQGSPSMRPSMSRVVAMLADDIEVSGVITRPSYLLTDCNFSDSTGRVVTGNAQGPGAAPSLSPVNVSEFSDIIEGK